MGPTHVSSVWHSARFVLWPRLGHAGRFSAPEVATCTNSCSKKVFKKRQGCGYTLPATTWLRCGLSSTRHLRRAACSEANRRMHFLQQERRYSGGAETSVCRRTWDVNCHQD